VNGFLLLTKAVSEMPILLENRTTALNFINGFHQGKYPPSLKSPWFRKNKKKYSFLLISSQ